MDIGDHNLLPAQLLREDTITPVSNFQLKTQGRLQAELLRGKQATDAGVAILLQKDGIIEIKI